MGAILSDIGHVSRPVWIDVFLVVKGCSLREVRARHGLEGRLEAMHQRIGFRRQVGSFLKRPAELIGGHDNFFHTVIGLICPV